MNDRGITYPRLATAMLMAIWWLRNNAPSRRAYWPEVVRALGPMGVPLEDLRRTVRELQDYGYIDSRGDGYHLYDAGSEVVFAAMQGGFRPPMRKNPDYRVRALERRWRESGLDEDWLAWTRARIRAGDRGALWELESRQADAEVELAQTGRSFPPILFPQARRWRDLFEEEAPADFKVSFRLPPELQGKVMPGYWQRVREYAKQIGLYPDPPFAGRHGEPSPSRKPGSDEASLSWRRAAPAGWSVDRPGYGVFDPLVIVKGLKWLCFYAKPRLEVLQAVEGYHFSGHDDYYHFTITVRDHGDEPATMLITHGSGLSVSEAWVAIMPLSELPEIAARNMDYDD